MQKTNVPVGPLVFGTLLLDGLWKGSKGATRETSKDLSDATNMLSGQEQGPQLCLCISTKWPVDLQDSDTFR